MVSVVSAVSHSARCSQLLAMMLSHGGYQGIIGEKPEHTVSYSDEPFTENGKEAAGYIEVDGKKITIYKEKDAANLPWGALDIDVVLECTGFYTSKDKSMAHVKAGAKKVVISAPAGNDLKTIVFNVNNETLTKDDQIISAASCTTNCLAPMAKALNDKYPIQAGIMQTIHAYTGDQMILDGPQRKGNLRRSRAGACNITPASSGAAKAIGLVLPELNGKLIGAAQRVPVPDGSTTLLYAVVLFDATQTMVVKLDDDTYEVQVVSWYDNENSYTSQMVRTIKYFTRKGNNSEIIRLAAFRCGPFFCAVQAMCADWLFLII